MQGGHDPAGGVFRAREVERGGLGVFKCVGVGRVRCWSWAGSWVFGRGLSLTVTAELRLIICLPQTGIRLSPCARAPNFTLTSCSSSALPRAQALFAYDSLGPTNHGPHQLHAPCAPTGATPSPNDACDSPHE